MAAHVPRGSGRLTRHTQSVNIAAMPEEHQASASDRLARLREHCRAFRSKLSPEDQASFDALLREAARYVQAGALDPDLMLSEVLALSLAVACGRQIEDLRAKVDRLEEHINSPDTWR